MRRCLLAATSALALFACSSDDTGGASASGASGTTSAASTTTTTGGDATPDESCVRPGEKGNEKGVGEYCTPSGGECSDFPEAGLCLASVGQDQWMCTRIGCDETTDCGDGAGCLIVPGSGSACVPCHCDEAGIGCGGGAGGGGSGGGSAGGGGAGGGSAGGGGAGGT